ncbi:MAG: hypothetical protein WA190_00045 [Usitatibacter sp.]
MDVATLISMFVGAAVTWLFAHLYYKRAGNELRAEAADLRKLISMLLLSLEQQGLAKLNRDASGNITGYIYEHVATGGVKVGGSAPVEFISAKPGSAS